MQSSTSPFFSKQCNYSVLLLYSPSFIVSVKVWVTACKYFSLTACLCLSSFQKPMTRPTCCYGQVLSWSSHTNKDTQQLLLPPPHQKNEQNLNDVCAGYLPLQEDKWKAINAFMIVWVLKSSPSSQEYTNLMTNFMTNFILIAVLHVSGQ